LINSEKTSHTLVILAPGSADDGGWSESAIQAGAAINQPNWQVRSYPNINDDLSISLINELAHKGENLFIGHGCEYIEPFLNLAPIFPNSFFFAMDKVNEPDNWPANYSCLFQKQAEAIYLAGYLSAELTRNKKLGFISGMKVPTQIANASAFIKGARDNSEDCDVDIEFAGSFVDPELGRKIALLMIENGIDVIMHSASETGNGVIDACREKEVQVIGYILDQSKMASDYVMASVVLDVERIYRQKLFDVDNGKFQPGVWTVGLAEGFLDLRGYNKKVTQRLQDDIKAIKSEIIGGAIKIY
jgi:basic membrane protein A and related proteins